MRTHKVIAWSLAYLGISSSLIGVLGAIGPGFAVDILGLTPENFFFIMGPAGLGAVLGILFLNSYGKSIPKRLVIDIGLIAMGITLILLAIVKPVANSAGAATGPLEEAIPAIAPLVSVIAVVVVISVFAGVEYSFVAIPAQTSLQEDLPADVRGRIFGILNTLLSVASFLPVLLAPAIADILNIFFEGAGIPAVMAVLGRHHALGRHPLVASERPPGPARSRSRDAAGADGGSGAGARARGAGCGRPGDAE